MPELRHSNGDVIAVPDQLVEYYERQGWERKFTPAEVENLKGAELNQALVEHGLPKSGKADEKRARLAEDQEN
jgi:hypothetical protein